MPILPAALDVFNPQPDPRDAIITYLHARIAQTHPRKLTVLPDGPMIRHVMKLLE